METEQIEAAARRMLSLVSAACRVGLRTYVVQIVADLGGRICLYKGSWSRPPIDRVQRYQDGSFSIMIASCHSAQWARFLIAKGIAEWYLGSMLTGSEGDDERIYQRFALELLLPRESCYENMLGLPNEAVGIYALAADVSYEVAWARFYQFEQERQMAAGNALKPPLGLKPREIALTGRLREVADAIQRYAHANPPMHIPADWIDELDELNVELTGDDKPVSSATDGL